MNIQTKNKRRERKKNEDESKVHNKDLSLVRKSFLERKNEKFNDIMLYLINQEKTGCVKYVAVLVFFTKLKKTIVIKIII